MITFLRAVAAASPSPSYVAMSGAAEGRDEQVGKSHRVELPEVRLAERVAHDPLFFGDQPRDRVDNPRIDFAQLEPFGAGDSEPQRVRKMIQAMTARHRDLGPN